ncbi:MAG: N-acetylglucosamine-6-phosphate deacetylase [Erysipelotrichaceae bacterium]|nr:N-acetylglucosamine-6-phosphate deacetylase [Erysipelotrichaceae bacterium]
MKILLSHAHLVVDGNREYLDGALLIEDEIIREVYPQTDKIKSIDEETKQIDLKGSLVMPGFFDTHTHGVKRMAFDTSTKQELDQICDEFSKDGTTSFLASLTYDLSPEELIEQLKVLDAYEGSSVRYQGIHIEGPYLNPKHLGMGDPDKFLKPDIEMVRKFLDTSSKIRQMTVAYELDGVKEIGQLLHDHGVRVMCGHSDAVYEDLDENVDGFTHLFNAMRSLHHRDITLVNCAFMNRWYCELISDGNHVDRNVLKLVLNNIDKDKIILVSDSSIARNLPDGEYEFISKKCTKKGTKFISHDGHYAGSVVSINDEMKVLYELGAKYCDLLMYSSLNAFRFYGLDKKYGTLEKGKYADLVIMDDDLNIRNVYVKGKFVYD